LFKKRSITKSLRYVFSILTITAGLIAIFYGVLIGLVLVALGVVNALVLAKMLSEKKAKLIRIMISAGAIIFLLATHWRPLDGDTSIFLNLLFVGSICFGVLGY